ncbi:placenta-specific gene 8 protein-like [Brachyhypopomus gauderio]|uniref:placenta-specific gene 8 protein-like n=1 Tax=Brachyhypopomus gauderio TaxID=698409 RepID=UPI0040434D0F
MELTTVVTQNQMQMTSKWNSGLCDCCMEMKSCCYAFWCCPCFACSTTADFGEGLCLPLIDILGPGMLAACGVAVCVPPVTLSMRTAVRNKYGIKGSLFEDIMISCCCIWCSWCQMHREIKYHNVPVMVVTSQPVCLNQPISTTGVIMSAPPGTAVVTRMM